VAEIRARQAPAAPPQGVATAVAPAVRVAAPPRTGMEEVAPAATTMVTVGGLVNVPHA